MAAAVMPPYFKCFTADDVQATELLSLMATGVYHRLQTKFFQLGVLPADDEKIRKLVKWPAKDRNWPTIRDELQEDVFGKDWRNPRWEALLDKVHLTSEKRAGAANARWSRPGARDMPPPVMPPPDSYYGPDDEADEMVYQ